MDDDEAVKEEGGDELLVGELEAMDEGLTELEAEAVPDADVVGEALSVLVPVSEGVSVGAVEPELEAEADDDLPLVEDTEAEALALGVPLGVSPAEDEPLGLAETVLVAVSRLELLPEPDGV